MATIKIADLKDVLVASRKVHEESAHQPWWRGHGREDWNLLPHVHRLSREKGPFYEANIANKFAKFAPTRHARCPPAGDLARWLFLMQHYGLPTRLLDWTESPLLAVYFAVWEDAHLTMPGALWAFDPYALNDQVVQEPGLLQPRHPVANALVEDAYALVSEFDQRVVALLSEEIDERMMVQMSGFTIHGLGKPLNQRPECDAVLRKFVILPEHKEHLREQLASIGIRERNVFPDLTHLAADLKRDRYAEQGID